ncbi:MAG: 1-acyl-sn-glycerol-3-phosphate acyltransferase [Bryobacteraceae bacterium]|nr:1-acyl-sn-glycerol-3-phosphate acyltransferase [Bryobacteraceae bacterium]
MDLRKRPWTGYLRSWLWTIPAASLVTAVLITAAIATSPFAPAGPWQTRLYRLWARAVLALFGVRVRVTGAEKLPPEGHYVIVSNHLSLADTPVMLLAVPVPFRFLAKRELLRVPFIGWYLRRAGHLTVDRRSVRSSIESLNEAARLIREHSLSVLIFAEGRRSPDGTLQPFRDGAAWLAIQSGAPAAPAAILGTDRVLPAKDSCILPGEVEVRFADPVSPAGFTLRDRAAFTRLLEDRVRSLLAGADSPPQSTQAG